MPNVRRRLNVIIHEIEILEEDMKEVRNSDAITLAIFAFYTAILVAVPISIFGQQPQNTAAAPSQSQKVTQSNSMEKNK
jgi:hypothetical protein